MLKHVVILFLKVVILWHLILHLRLKLRRLLFLISRFEDWMTADTAWLAAYFCIPL